VRDPAVRDFLRLENPAAARAIALRLSDALRRGLWHPRGNAIHAELAALMEPA
jgi:cobaltochelatase CobN